MPIDGHAKETNDADGGLNAAADGLLRQARQSGQNGDAAADGESPPQRHGSNGVHADTRVRE
jgi:hypothetical protein